MNVYIMKAAFEAPFKKAAKEKAKENKLNEEALLREAALKEEALLREENITLKTIPKPTPLPPTQPQVAQQTQETEIYGANGPRPIIQHTCCYILDHENP
jgi:hypothetical protein